MPTIYEKETLAAQVDVLVADLKSYITQAVGREELQEVERTVFRRLQVLGRAFLEGFIAATGTGYQAGHPPVTAAGHPLCYKGTVTSPYWSVFGEVEIRRAGYARPEGGYYYPVDVQLNLPARKYSYLLQKWLQAGASETDFRQAVERLNALFDWSLFPEVPQRLGLSLAAQVAPFYAQQPAPEPEREGSHLALSVDGKGVPMLPSARGEELPPATTKPRLGKGEKRGTKKEALVTVDFSFDPQPRDPEEVLKGLMKQHTEAERQQAHQERQQRRQQGLPEPRQPHTPHVRATLQGKESAFPYLMDRVRKRDPQGHKRLIGLIDGKVELEIQLRQQAKAAHLEDRLDALILDIIHVSEYVWEVGTALYGETSPQRVLWVEDKLRALLHSQVGYVLGGLKQRRTKNALPACQGAGRSPAQDRALHKAITYFENHRHLMDYATYLAKGYPIATGLVEGTCGSLVKDRMEQSGMRWSMAGAQAVLDQRAVWKNGDWDDLWTFYIEQERTRLYSTTYARAA